MHLLHLPGLEHQHDNENSISYIEPFNLLQNYQMKYSFPVMVPLTVQLYGVHFLKRSFSLKNWTKRVLLRHTQYSSSVQQQVSPY